MGAATFTAPDARPGRPGGLRAARLDPPQGACAPGAEAERRQTRERRVAKALEMLRAGVSLS
ncbi:MAG TPA: hypothetical protein VHX88_12570 [Solirubrobacteraceae bacterium]|nr:hypothetical protein [Solirubrobacteraceae bacterium]